MRKRLGLTVLAACLAVGCGGKETPPQGQQPQQGPKPGAKAPGKQAGKKDGPAAKGKAPAAPAKDPWSDPSLLEAMIVAADGTGPTVEEATRDALVQAVRQAVGTATDAKPRAANRQAIADRVLAAPEKWVKLYEQLGKKDDAGKAKVKVKVAVDRSAVVAELKAAGVPIKKGFLAGLTTDMEAQKKARADLAKVLKGFPVNVLTARVLGEGEKAEETPQSVKVRARVRIEPNLKAYDALIEPLQEVLKVLARDQGSFTLTAEKHDTADHLSMAEEPYSWQEAVPGVSSANPPVVVAVNTRRDLAKGKSEWNYYVLDPIVRPLLMGYHQKTLNAKVALLAKGQREVAAQRFPALQSSVGYGRYKATALVDPLWSEGRGGRVYVISPFFVADSDRIRYLPAMEFERLFPLTLKEVKAVQSVKCELLDEGPAPPVKKRAK